MLELAYQEVKKSMISDSYSISVQYFNDYYQGVSKLWKGMVIIFIVANCMALLIAGIR